MGLGRDKNKKGGVWWGWEGDENGEGGVWWGWEEMRIEREGFGGVGKG